jgi:hypothetical protein
MITVNVRIAVADGIEFSDRFISLLSIIEGATERKITGKQGVANGVLVPRPWRIILRSKN